MRKPDHERMMRDVYRQHRVILADLKRQHAAEVAELQEVVDKYAAALDAQDQTIIYLEKELKKREAR